MRKYLSKRNIIFLVLFALVGWLMVFTANVVDELTAEGDLIWSGYTVAIYLLKSSWGILIGVLLLCFNVWQAERNKCLAEKSCMTRLKPWGVWLISTGVLMISFLPAFLAYYPGICSYDSYIQVEQIVTGVYNEHHPLIHTMLIRFFLWLGGNGTTGIAIYSVVQMTALSMAMAYAVRFVYVVSRRICKWLWIVVLAVFVAVPFNRYLAVTVTKDVLFSAFVLLLVTVGIELGKESSKRSFILLGLSTFGVATFRNNGKYALLVITVVLAAVLIIFRKNKTVFGTVCKALMVTALCTVAGMLTVTIISKNLNATQGDRREMLSTPIQQLARVRLLEEDISESDKALIDEFLLNESYKLYEMDISDPVKRNTNTYVVRYRTKEFLDTYLGLMRSYPGEYLNAFLGVNAGFLSVTDETHAVVNQKYYKDGMGYIQTEEAEYVLVPAGIKADSKIPKLHEYMEDWATDNGHLRFPVIRFLLMPGIYLWINVFVFLEAIRRRSKWILLPQFFVLLYFGTMLLGPTVQLRYIYPIMLTSMVSVVGLLFINHEQKE